MRWLALLLCSGLLLPAGGGPCVAGTIAMTPQRVAEELFGRSEALVIGISRYHAGWPTLPGVAGDVAAVRRGLLALHFVPSPVQQDLVDDPTGAEMLKAITAAFDARAGGDRGDAAVAGYRQLLVYFAGHGATCFPADAPEVRRGEGEACPKDLDNGRAQGFILGSDAPPLREITDEASAKRFRQAAISMEDLLAIARSATAIRHVVFVLDSCFSGAIIREGVAAAAHQPDRSLPEAAIYPAVEFLTSGTYNQQVPDVSRFRQFFLRGLEGAADEEGSGYITASRLAQYVAVHVEMPAAGAPPQTPQFGRLAGGTLDRGEFIFRTSFETAADTVPLSVQREASWRDLLVYQECPECPQLVIMPAGRFRRGSPAGEAGRAPGEPDSGDSRAETTVGRFAIGRYDVTYAEWDACFADNGCRYWPDDSGRGRGNRPVAGVSLDDAASYVAWLSRHTGSRYRLPSELEWEYAARAGAAAARPWGDAIGSNRAACDGCGSQFDARAAAPVGSFPPNAFGLYDAVGNLWQWTCAHPLPGEGAERRWNVGCGEGRLRGGSFLTRPKGVRLAVSAPYQHDARTRNIGFRVVRELGPPAAR